ncbi:hypothetical protein EXIGLDRAFT_734209, partial [Exidia glandulosa HHB12029]
MTTVPVNPTHDTKLSVIPPLDPTLLVLRPDEIAFLKQQTGIESDENIKQHVLRVQERAYAVFPYPCIHHFYFTSLKISHFPAYGHLLKMGQERKGALFLDLGCCFGNDARKLAVDGFPVSQILAVDFNAEFWELGNELFGTTTEKCGIRFIPGDAFSSTLLDTTATPVDAPSSLASIDSLTPLIGHLSAIHASSFFHLFFEDKQALLARRVAALVKREPGSIVFGSHVGAKRKGVFSAKLGEMFCHSPESWTQLWLA